MLPYNSTEQAAAVICQHVLYCHRILAAETAPFCSFPLWMRLECPCDFSIQGGHSAPLTSFHYISWAKSSLYLGINRKDDKNSNPVFAIPKKAVTFAFREQQRVYELAFEYLKWENGLWYECRIIHCLWWVAFPLAVWVFSTISS